MTTQPVELSTSPALQRQVKMSKERLQSRRGKAAGVVPPASQDGIVSDREFRKRTRGLSRDVPTADLLAHPLLCLTTDARKKARKVHAFWRHCLSRSERETQKRKLRHGILATPIAVLAVHNPCFLRMKLQPTRRKALVQKFLHPLGLPLRPTVHYRIIGVAGERTIRHVPPHPPIKRVMHEEIHEQRADQAPLRGTTDTLPKLSAVSHRARPQPAFNV